MSTPNGRRPRVGWRQEGVPDLRAALTGQRDAALRHCVAPAFSAGWDSLTALDLWVTGGGAPPNPVVSGIRPGANRTRPLCEYPKYPQYNGTGDLNYASSFTCVRSAALVRAARTLRFGGR